MSLADTGGGRRLDRRQLLTGLAPSRRETGGHWIRVHRPAMACRFEVTLGSEEARFVPVAREALDEVDALEAALTVFRDSSELVRVNREAAAGPVPVSSGLMQLLRRCETLSVATGGAFDPTSTPLSRTWGFLARQGRVPSPEEIEEARERVGMRRVALDPSRQTVSFTHPGVELNMGSVGKGWALDRIASGLRERGLGRALVSAGGSSFLGWGQDSWPLVLAPGREKLADLWLEDASLATSGAGEQHVEREGRRLGHVIDPRTGWPAEGVQSATVVASDATTADALATAFLVGGPSLARDWCREHPQTLVLLTLADEPRTLVALGARDGVDVAPAEGVCLTSGVGADPSARPAPGRLGSARTDRSSARRAAGDDVRFDRDICYLWRGRRDRARGRLRRPPPGAHSRNSPNGRR